MQKKYKHQLLGSVKEEINLKEGKKSHKHCMILWRRVKIIKQFEERKENK
jgi:hypothetical protein